MLRSQLWTTEPPPPASLTKVCVSRRRRWWRSGSSSVVLVNVSLPRSVGMLFRKTASRCLRSRVASHSRTSRISTPARRSAHANAVNTDRRASSFTKSLRTPRQRIPSYRATARARRSPTRNETGLTVIAGGLSGSLDQFGRSIDAFNGVTSAASSLAYRPVPQPASRSAAPGSTPRSLSYRSPRAVRLPCGDCSLAA